MDDKERLKNYIKLEDIFRLYNLNEGKRGFWECYAHTDKTPSLHLLDDDNFYCHSCKKKGDIFTVIMDKEGIDFKEAMLYLSDKFDIPLSHKQGDDGKAVYMAVLNALAGIFAAHSKRSLFEDRGFTDEYIKSEGLGFCGAPAARGGALAYLKKTFGNLAYSDWGLVNKNGDFILNNRMIIPVKNKMGKVVNFIGRAIGEDSYAKYLPIKDNQYFRKREHLFLFNKHRASDVIYLVEGHIDALSLDFKGIPAAAVGGTVLSDEQKLLLKGKKIILFFDKDSPGITGMVRIIKDNLDVNFSVARFDHPDVNDANDALIRGCMDHTVVSDLLFMASLVRNKEDLKEYFSYLNHKASTCLSADDPIGIDLLDVQEAVELLKSNESLDIKFDLQTIIEKKIFGWEV